MFDKIKALYDRTYSRALKFWEYVSGGVWEDRRDTWKVNVVKTLNLTIRTFLSSDLQTRACAMTYRTLLAMVPALALLFAIGRGFGFQNVLQSQLYSYFPSQHKALDMAFSFVDSCLAQASEGIFVGVGIVFLLWTLISLLDSVEDAFNNVWGVTSDRSLARKVTDYLAICIILPVLMICSGGIQIFMSNAIQRILPFDFTPFLGDLLDVMSIVFSWLFFAGSYMLIPNTRVRFKNAALAGILAGSAFQVLQWLFVSGQVYVAKYNAIYGSFSFLPLMLIWMQLSWLITLAGALVCNASQNIFLFSYERQIDNISSNYRRKVCLAILTVILQRFRTPDKKPYTTAELSQQFVIPPKLTGIIVKFLVECHLIIRAMPQGCAEDRDEDLPLVPATSLEHYTVGHVLRVLGDHGESGFIPELEERFGPLCDLCDRIISSVEQSQSSVLLYEVSDPTPIKNPKQ